MLDATASASVRLAHALAKLDNDLNESESRKLIDGLRRARWALGLAYENAGLAKHMGSASSRWLNKLRREFTELRKEIASLIHEQEERRQPASSTGPAGLRGTSDTPSDSGEQAGRSTLAGKDA